MIAVLIALYPTVTLSGFFWSSQDGPPPKIGYLSFQSPPKLMFHEKEPLADRRKLITLDRPTNIDQSPSISTTNEPENTFPLVDYGVDQNNSEPMYTLPASVDSVNALPDTLLPPNDPFVTQDLSVPNLNNTDELIKILESSQDSSSRTVGSRVDFIPPYNLDGGNMLLQSKSRYIRRSR